MELIQKSTIIFPEISGKIPEKISELPTLVWALRSTALAAGAVVISYTLCPVITVSYQPSDLTSVFHLLTNLIKQYNAT